MNRVIEEQLITNIGHEIVNALCKLLLKRYENQRIEIYISLIIQI
jgi:hypothetical protein